MYALAPRVEIRLLDRLELDDERRERDIRIQLVDSVLVITGEVWTPLEKQRSGK